MITLSSMTYTIDLDASEFWDAKVFNDFMMNARILHFTYDRG